MRSISGGFALRGSLRADQTNRVYGPRTRPVENEVEMTCLTCARTVPSTTEHAPGEEWRTAQHPVKAYREVPAGSVAARIMRHRS